ncbi:sarcoplasmic calcium-binding proteins II, V, VI, and VII-like [Babylonia areolata]|uniref:sarcoplasmic calcium-binding proteins II, V, VI, and VII-like n=1 Tax=Babylonia areolata TaxID=304850 RepID=UPI003FD1A615
MSGRTVSSFQREKLTYFFNFFQPNENNELDENSLRLFMERLLEYTRWDPQSADANSTREVLEAFFEILFDKTADQGTSTSSVSKEDWFAVWENLLPGCKGWQHFPVWLRLLPKQLFRAIDRDKDKKIGEEELFNFYLCMVKLPYEEAKNNSKLAFSQMTDNGRYPLTLSSYEQVFANFLLGQTPFGPGRHIFGCFEHTATANPFRLIQPAPEPDDFDMDVKVYLEKRPKRTSLA